MKFGVNSWIWVSPLTTDEIARLAPLAASLGAEWFEVPLEDPATFVPPSCCATSIAVRR